MRDRFFLRVRAPFAAYRWMQAGVYRATSPVPPFSALAGFVLNLAGVETRGLAEGDTPPLRLAVGAVVDARVSALYQQLHGYPVGASGKAFKARAFGTKYWIAPVRREVLVGLDVLVGVESPDADLRDRVVAGLDGAFGGPTYGLPFAGDNNFMLDRVDVLDAPHAARWYARLDPTAALVPHSCRLTIAIDREDQSRTRSDLFAPVAAPAPPDAAWVWTPAPPAIR